MESCVSIYLHDRAAGGAGLSTRLGDELMKLSSGNARRIDIGDGLDGPASAFGRAFWKALASDAPLIWAAMKQHGVASVHYTDRYFLTPLNKTLLAQVLAAAPGEPKLSITTARLERAGDPGFLVFHPSQTTKGARGRCGSFGRRRR